jgi:hypothetical protein
MMSVANKVIMLSVETSFAALKMTLSIAIKNATLNITTLSIMTLSIKALDNMLSVIMLSVENKVIILNIIMLSVVAPLATLRKKRLTNS